jgi:hypothetical protein
VQKSAPKILVTEESLAKSNKDGFGDEIGTTTNRTTEHYDLLALFEEDSEEYKELTYRIMCGQHFQQCAIDKIKGIKSKPMPKEWYDYKACRLSEEDSDEERAIKEFNARIVANKKPYFFIYIYPHLHKEYVNFIKEADDKCKLNFKMSAEELLSLDNWTEEEFEFVQYYYANNPVSDTNSTMNRICKYIEEEFKKDKKVVGESFDHSILRTSAEYSKKDYRKIEKIYEEYCAENLRFKTMINKERMRKEEISAVLDLAKEDFYFKCITVCSNIEELTNILVDMCYKKNKTKQFVWDVVGTQIIDNLLERNDMTINYLEKCPNGEVEYQGYKFKLKQTQKMKRCNNEINT